MRWAAHASTAESPVRAAEEARAMVEARLGGAPDLLLGFFAPGLDDEVAHALADPYPDAVVMGCSSGGVIANDREIEDGAAVSVVGARLPKTQIRTLAFGEGLGQLLEARHVQARLSHEGHDPALVIGFLDPRAGDPSSLLAALDEAFPRTPKLGGLASGDGRGPPLLVDGRASAGAGVLIAFHGGLQAEALVAQGCRPIGQAMLTTRCDGQLIHEIGQSKPVDVMRGLYETLDDDDKQLFRQALLLGVEMRDQLEYQAGDFLMRNILGVDPNTGALAVSSVVEDYKAVQFHIRDGRSAAEQMRNLTAKAAERGPAEAILLFSCLGRGKQLYNTPHHDVRVLHGGLGKPPIAGFFSGGEIGPVAGVTHLHAYTSAAALIREA